jgi:hypothetical protein
MTTDTLATLYSEFSLLRRQMEDAIRASEQAVSIERARFDRLLTEYMKVCQALASRPSAPSSPLPPVLTQGLGIFEEVPLGSEEGYTEEELDIGSAYQEGSS